MHTTHETIRQAAESSILLRAVRLGVSTDALARMEQEGSLERVIPGVYIGSQHRHHSLIEAAAWTLRHPHAVTGLLTAAVFHDLTNAFARGTWLFVPRGASPPRSQTASVHAIQTAPRFIEPTLDVENGICSMIVHGVEVRLTTPDRTTLDLFRYPRRIPSEYALDALRRRMSAPDFQLPLFARLGRRLGAWKKIEQLVQGLVLR